MTRLLSVFWQSRKARAIAGGVLMLLIAVAAVATFVGKSPLQTDLLALLPVTERNVRAEEAVNHLATTTGNRIVFLVGHTNADTARAAASRMAIGLQGSAVFQNAMAELPPIDLAQLTQLYRTHRYFLLTPADRAALTSGKFGGAARIEAKLLRPSMVGITLPVAEDPWGLTDAWLDQLPLKTLQLEPDQGFLSTQAKGVTWVLVSAQLKGSAFDYAVQQQAVTSVDQAIAAEATLAKDVQVLRMGAVFYAYAARASAEREIDIIGAGSAIGALLLLYWVFRSIKPLLLGLVTVAAGVAAAATVSVWAWGSIHVMTLVFGASLIGEAIDYAVQYFAAHLGYGHRPQPWDSLKGLRKITPGLAIALATSALGYAALSLAPFPALKQIALFALVGLGVAWLLVFLWLPYWLHKPNQRNPEVTVAMPVRILAWWQRQMTWKPALVVALTTLLLAAPGWWRLSSNDDVRLLINKPVELAAQEAQIRALAGFGNTSQFYLVEGASIEEVLVRSEALGERLRFLTDSQSVARFVPSVAVQVQNRAAWDLGVFADEKKLRQSLEHAGLKTDIADQRIAAFKASQGQQLRLVDWLQSPLSAPYQHLWLGEKNKQFAAIVLPSSAKDTAKLEATTVGLQGVTFVDKAGSVGRLFQDYRVQAMLWLLCALVLVYGVLCLRYRWRQAAIVLLPTVLAMALTLGGLGWLGTPLTLFNWMAMLLVLGVGVNYAIFLVEGGVHLAATLAGVLLSAGTTLLSFGLLALSSMPALSNFGLTLLLGVSFAVVFAPLVLSFSKEKTI